MDRFRFNLLSTGRVGTWSAGDLALVGRTAAGSLQRQGERTAFRAKVSLTIQLDHCGGEWWKSRGAHDFFPGDQVTPALTVQRNLRGAVGVIEQE